MSEKNPFDFGGLPPAPTNSKFRFFSTKSLLCLGLLFASGCCGCGGVGVGAFVGFYPPSLTGRWENVPANVTVEFYSDKTGVCCMRGMRPMPLEYRVEGYFDRVLVVKNKDGTQDRFSYTREGNKLTMTCLSRPGPPVVLVKTD